jgi:iron(III) transport system substrate-binding protein
MEQVSRRKILAMASAAALTGGMSMAHAQSWEEVVDAAKKEGLVVFATSAVGAPQHRAVGKLFQARYGIPVEYFEARAAELDERMRVEATTDRVSNDVGLGSAYQIKQRSGTVYAAVLPDVPNARNLSGSLRRDDTSVPFYIQRYSILANTRLVAAKDEPKQWSDILDPKWKGKILVDDFRSMGGGFVLFAALYDKFGREFHEKLARQDVVFSHGLVEAERRVARGEYPLLMPVQVPDIFGMKGLPAKLIIPEEGVAYMQMSLGMVAKCPHPNAARLLIDFFLSKEGQGVYANSGFGTVTASEGVTDAAKDLVDMKLMGTYDPARREEMLGILKSIYG